MHYNCESIQCEGTAISIGAYKSCDVLYCSDWVPEKSAWYTPEFEH